MEDELFNSLLILVAVVAFVIFVAMGKGCSNGDKAIEVLQAEGYEAIHTTGWNAFGCGRDDQCTGFTAKGPGGRVVKGVVGCGWFFNGRTVRITGTGP